VLLRMCVPQSGSPSRAAGSVRALPVALSRRMWISLIRYWRSGSIWQKCERRGKSKAFLLQEFWASRAGGTEQEQRDEVGEGVPPGSGSACWYYDRVVKVSFGRVEWFARTVGDNEVVGPYSSGLGGVECHGSVRGSVRTFGLRCGSRRRTFSYPLQNGLLCWKSAA
jgi:hypothetical protein